MRKARGGHVNGVLAVVGELERSSVAVAGSVPVAGPGGHGDARNKLSMNRHVHAAGVTLGTAAPSTSLGEALSIVGLSWSSLSLPSAAMLTTPWFSRSGSRARQPQGPRPGFPGGHPGAANPCSAGVRHVDVVLLGAQSKAQATYSG